MPDNVEVIRHRGSKYELDPLKPYHLLHESEPDRDGQVKKVNTVFLTNRECPFKCVFCDLWKHTLDHPTPPGAIPAQIRYALDRLPEADVIKLYNNGNFFDPKAIPKSDYPEIADLLKGYDRIILENHPKIRGSHILEFREMTRAKLEIALGVETIHPEILPRLNKQLTREDITDAAAFFTGAGIDLRAFVLLNPPFLTDEQENRHWCLETVKFSFDIGCTAVSVIPVRTGNGMMEVLEQSGDYVKPSLEALEGVFEDGLNLNRGRVFVDIWDIERFSDHPSTLEKRKARLEEMNLTQRVLPRVVS